MASTRKASPTASNRGTHPDHGDLLPRLSRAQGQLHGVSRMIEERRYCPEIIQQLRATRKALASIEAALLEKHLRECVADAINSKVQVKLNEKIVEIMKIFRSGQENGIELKDSRARNADED